MRTATARLAKIEARMPAPTPTAEPDGAGMCFEESLAAVMAESARVEKLSPQEKIHHYRNAIEGLRERCSKPPEPNRPGRVPGLSVSLHAAVVASSRYRIADMAKGTEQASHECGTDVLAGKQPAQ